MAQTEEQSPPRTIAVPGDGTATLSYTFPDAVALDLQSVYVEIDAGGAGDTIATVAVLDQSQVVIAAKAQSEPIPAGDTGSATWALRLADDGGGASTRTTVAAQIARGGGATAATVASGALILGTTFMQHNVAVYANGVTADVVSVPSRLVIVTAGLYLVNVVAAWADLGAADYGNSIGYSGVASPANSPLQVGRRIPSQVLAQEGTVLLSLAAGTAITQILGQNSGVAKAMPLGALTAVRLGPRP